MPKISATFLLTNSSRSLSVWGRKMTGTGTGTGIKRNKNRNRNRNLSNALTMIAGASLLLVALKKLLLLLVALKKLWF